jgi:hypothetical protein
MRSLLALLLLTTPALAGPLAGKSYIVELSSTQSSSGLGDYLLPPLMAELAASEMHPHKILGPGADLVANVTWGSDVGRWVAVGGEQVWIYTVTVTVGLSPEAYSIPLDGTPAYGVRANLETPNPDREDEMACLIRLATRTALANYRPEGILTTDGSACLRR